MHRTTSTYTASAHLILVGLDYIKTLNILNGNGWTTHPPTIVHIPSAYHPAYRHDNVFIRCRSTDSCFATLPSAVCSTCGSLNEHCCNVKSRCNGNHLQCVENQCVSLMKSTQMDVSNGVDHKQYLEWSIETGVMLMFFVCLCSVLAAHIRRTNRERMKRNKRNMTAMQGSIECDHTNDDNIITQTETNQIIDGLYTI
eukprot:331862_1